MPANITAQVAVLPGTPAGLYELLLTATSRGITEIVPLYLTVQDDPDATDLQMGYITYGLGDVAVAGEVYSYTLAPRNISANPALNTEVVETTDNADVLTLADDGGCAVDDSGTQIDLTCALGDLPADSENVDVTIAWLVNPDVADGMWINHRGVVSSTVTETSQLDNESEYAVQVVRRSDLELLTQADVAVAGSSLTYTTTVTNYGPSYADGVTVDLYLPLGVSLAAATAGCVQDVDLVTCDVGALAVDESAEVTVTVGIVPDFQWGGMESLFVATSQSEDLYFYDNYEFVYSDVFAAADLTVAITPDRAEAVEGETVDYLITVENHGPSQATAVDLALIMPDSSDIVDVRVGDVTEIPNELTIAAGASLTVTVSVLFMEDSAGQLVLMEAEASAAEANLVTASDESLVVSNANPTAVLSDTFMVNEGEWGILRVSVDDAGTTYDPLTVAWDLNNDGVFNDASGAIALFDARTVDGPATQPIAVKVTDDEGGQVVVSSVVAIQNVAPAADAGVDQTHQFDQPFVVDLHYVDPSPTDSHSTQVDWGDGTVDTMPGGVRASVVQISHTYNKVGVFTVNACVTDNNGGQGCDQIIAQAACQENGLTAQFDSTGAKIAIQLTNPSGKTTIPAGLPFTLYSNGAVLHTFTLDQESARGRHPVPGLHPDRCASDYLHVGSGHGRQRNRGKTTQLCSGKVERTVALTTVQLFLPLVNRQSALSSNP